VSYELICSAWYGAKSKAIAPRPEQAAADFENTRLMLTTQLVSDYFTLRELDSEIDVSSQFDSSVTRSLSITSRHDLGFATGLDLAQQQALVQSSAHNWSCCKCSARRTSTPLPRSWVRGPSFTIAPVVTPATCRVSRRPALRSVATRSDVASAEERSLRQCTHRRRARSPTSRHSVGCAVPFRLGKQRSVDLVQCAEPALVGRLSATALLSQPKPGTAGAN